MIFSPEVEQAKKDNTPLLALESTIISHGMPYPQNFECALEVEGRVRKEGCVPATMAVISGQIRIGLTKDEIHEIAKNPIPKAQSRDLAYLISQKKSGSTTVSLTSKLAHMSGIQVMATGGLGGVHRNCFDISADLWELSQTPVAVISSGVKSILDIEKTLEVLETLSVPVFGLMTDEFPAFTSYSSRIPLNSSFHSAQEAAIYLDEHFKYHRAGVLLAHPVPLESAIDRERMESSLKLALSEAQEKGVTGKEVTPYLLKRLNELSGGETLRANLALIKENAQIASKICRLRR